ncbi:MAG TPA: long-chain-acyl-CoA synthetase [Candidatus Binatia bacterium]|nr:long-chain-acyl-CoA synthetase [Candidatus Binatia bacterium]
MDVPSRIATLVEDLIELPRFLEIRRALQGAGAGAFRTMGYVCRDQAERIPDRVALRFERETVTFGEFNRGVNRWANALRAAGAGKGDAVNLMMENSPAMLMAQGACAKLGAIAALVNTHLEGEALAHVHRASKAKIALVDRACSRAMLPLLERLPDVTVFGDVPDIVVEGSRFRSLGEALDAATEDEPDIPDVKIGDVFLYVYTSGTTGFPKPAIVRHARFTAGGHSLSILLEETPDDCAYAPTPLYHGYANFVGFAPAFHRGACFASRRKFSATEFLDDVRRHGVTIFCYVGELCRYLMRQPPTPRDRDHRIRLATGPGLRPDIWEAFRDRFGIPKIIDSYGQTEGNVSLQNRRGRVGSCGRCAPFTHDSLRLARYDLERGELVRGSDGFLVECGVGEAGELLSRVAKDSPMAFDGYADRADNEKKLLRDCFEKGDTWLRTGDLLKRDYAAYYYFVDRIGDTFRWKGENVATMEVEHLLNRAPGVHETAVYGVRIPGSDGRAGMALVVPADGAAFDPASFYAHAARTLPAYARPLFVRVADAVDVTGNFKNRKLRLQDEAFDLDRVRDPLWLRDDERATYVPLDRALADEIAAGRRKL